MRIISGKFKGHSLVSFKADHIRPTTDRVKESLFNKIRDSLEGARVLDLFCGTGNLGLEAISRGAVHCLFVDAQAKSLSITKENIDKLKIDKKEYSIQKEDVLRFLKKYEGEGFDVIFIDPPFTEKMAHEVMDAVSKSRIYLPHCLISIESQKKERIDEQYGELKRFDFKEYGDKSLSLYKMEKLEKVDTHESYT
ncbi:MAG TPA: 16S rRNA (guanine(966)-N(2))-methyltransferase RsmD [Pseudobdellovibrionaceae bacterium]|nr:16S rRNA (guanine(966)-N(2))-methyltransferase RsmD [Pseudobdellovibrionaceae bacterium]